MSIPFVFFVKFQVHIYLSESSTEMLGAKQPFVLEYFYRAKLYCLHNRNFTKASIGTPS